MKAVILAGGKGSRLGSLASMIPKPMIRIGSIPLLHHQVNLLGKYGINEIILLVNYLSRPVIEYFGDGRQFGVTISYFEESEPLGTSGGLKEIEPYLIDDFVILYGDVMINMDLERLIRFHRSSGSQCTLVLHPNDHPYDSDLVDMDENNRIVAIHPKPHDPGRWYHNMVNAGAYVFSPEVLKFIEKGKNADLGRDVFPEIVDRIRMFGYHTAEYLKDMGTPERLEKVRADYESEKIKFSSYDFPRKAVFLDRDGVVNTERSFISRPEDLEIFSFTAPAVKRINDSQYLAIVVTNQSVVARNLCTEEDVRTIHRKLETELGKNQAWLDAIYYCPHHPDKGYPEENSAYKIVCDCRKPATGMFKKAIEAFHIDPSESYMIGDTERDIQAGKNIGCATVGVRTGYGIKKTRILPDYMFNDIREAVDFIVDDPLMPHYKEINELFSQFSGTKPWIILIGGNARSGKSILASYLRIRFEKTGRKVLQVSLDNWILPENVRHSEMNVYDRFRLKSIETDFIELLKGNAVTVSPYVNHPERSPIDLTYDPGNTDILIIEGVVALSSPLIRNSAHLKIFTTVEPGLFKKRMVEYYTWRGKSADQTSDLIEKRETDEYQLIEKESKLADLIINSAPK